MPSCSHLHGIVHMHALGRHLRNQHPSACSLALRLHRESCTSHLAVAECLASMSPTRLRMGSGGTKVTSSLPRQVMGTVISTCWHRTRAPTGPNTTAPPPAPYSTCSSQRAVSESRLGMAAYHSHCAWYLLPSSEGFFTLDTGHDSLILPFRSFAMWRTTSSRERSSST